MSFRNKTCFKTVLRNRNSSDGFKFSMYSDPDLCSKLWKPHKHYKLFFIGNIFFSLTRHVKNCEFFFTNFIFLLRYIETYEYRVEAPNPFNR